LARFSRHGSIVVRDEASVPHGVILFFSPDLVMLDSADEVINQTVPCLCSRTVAYPSSPISDSSDGLVILHVMMFPSGAPNAL